MFSIAVEKTYDRIPKEIIQLVVEKKHVYNSVQMRLKDKYHRVMTNVRTVGEEKYMFQLQ